MEEQTLPTIITEDPRPPLTRRHHLAEMLVVLPLILPAAIVGAFGFKYAYYPFALRACSTMVRDLAFLALLLFLLWRNGESRRAIGWQFRWPDLGLGVLLYVPLLRVTHSFGDLFRAVGLKHLPGPTLTGPLPTGTIGIVLAVAMIATVAITEESFYRGYLLLRLRGVGGNAFVALLGSALCFALQHAYQGPLGLANTAVGGILLGLVYLWRRNLTALVVLHFLWNLSAYHLLPIRFLYM